MSIKLMIKTHVDTGLKYLCKTTREGKAFDEYLGSGTFWRRHLNKHGKNVSTEVIFETNDPVEFEKTALQKSIEFDVVQSENWANLVYEMGQGGIAGAAEETRAKIGAVHRGVPKSSEQRAKMSAASKGKKKSESHAVHCRTVSLGRKHPETEKAKRAETLKDVWQQKYNLPSKSEMISEVRTTSVSAVARKYGCSRPYVRKHIA